jgi:fucose permease
MLQPTLRRVRNRIWRVSIASTGVYTFPSVRKRKKRKSTDGDPKSKLDRRIIPAFWILYFLCSAVRSNVGLAQTMNAAVHHDLGSVLHLTPRQISTGLALFYVCYVVFDFPSNLIMTRLSPHVWMSRIVISVGIIGSCLTAMKAAWSF